MQIILNSRDLNPVISAAVRETLAQLSDEADLFSPDRLAYPEAEAAQLLGVAKHVLGDSRRRGEISGSRVGKKILYRRQELIDFLV